MARRMRGSQSEHDRRHLHRRDRDLIQIEPRRSTRKSSIRPARQFQSGWNAFACGEQLCRAWAHAKIAGWYTHQADMSGATEPTELFTFRAKRHTMSTKSRGASLVKRTATPSRARQRTNGQSRLQWVRGEFDMAAFQEPGTAELRPHYTTALGALFDGDCLEVLPRIRSESVDTVFADPPFNLGKEYGKRTNDRRDDAEYITWCKSWLRECIRILKPGGSLFVYNLPKWGIPIGAYLQECQLTFRHWIAVEISACLPIPGRLHPSHYALLYYTKGKAKTFRRIRTPVQTCRHCGGEVKDYGGHRGALNPKGLNLKDVWADIPPVRHAKFKSDSRKANALSTKLLDRVVEMSTYPGDVVLDPFGGSGTTFAVCEQRDRRWLGIEIDFADVIVARLRDADLHHHHNDDTIDD